MLFFAFKPCLNTVFHPYSTHGMWSFAGSRGTRTYVRESVVSGGDP